MNRKKISLMLENYIHDCLKSHEYNVDSGFGEMSYNHQKLEIILNYLQQPITLADFLGWEENVEYEYNEAIYRLKDNQIEVKAFEEFQFPHGVKINFITNLQQATKVEPKLKAYHVKDEYSYNELMKELEEQGYDMNFKKNPCVFEGEIYIFEDEEKKELGFSIIKLNKVLEKYDLIEYHKEEPKYYAKIKGTQIDIRGVHGLRQEFTMRVWNELGINNTNADWEEVKE